MQFSKYRYNAVHAISEKLIEIIAPLVSSGKGSSVNKSSLKILVLKFGGMGEAVLARSIVERLKERNPNLSFDFLAEKRTAEMMTIGSKTHILLYDPGIDGISKALKTLKEIRHRRYDAIIDFEQHSLLTAAFARASSIPIRIGFAPSSSMTRGKMFTHPVELREAGSMWSAFIRVGQALDPYLSDTLMTVPLPSSSMSDEWYSNWRKANLNKDAEGPLVAMHIGVGPSAQYRRWPIERFVSLADAITKIRSDATILLTGAKSEQSLIANFSRAFCGKNIDASDIGGLEHTAALLKQCDLLICADTGIMHLAAAMGTPTVGLFGPNTPTCWGPVGQRATSVYPTRQPCSPCINSYLRKIPSGCTATQESACMWDISIHDVLTAARKVVKGSWLS